MKNRLFDYIFLIRLAFGVTIVLSLIMYPSLPANMPMQFASDGSINWTLPKFLGIFLIPAFAAFIAFYYKKGDGVGLRQVFSIWLLLIVHLLFTGYSAYIY